MKIRSAGRSVTMKRYFTQSCPTPPGFEAARMRIGTVAPFSRRSRENR